VTATVPLRHLAEVNPPTREFARLGRDESVTFMPLETVWADQRVDFSRRVPKSEVASGYTRFRDGDVLVPKVAPTFQAGRVAVATIGTPAGAGTTELHVVRSHPDISDPRFLAYVCRSAPFLAEGVSTFQGVAGLQRVPDEFVKSFPVASMNLDEQRRIADFLDTETTRLDRMMALREREAALLVEASQTMLDHALDDLIDEFGIHSLRRVIRAIEQGSSPQCDAIPAEESQLGVLKLSAVNRGAFIAGENKALPRDTIPDLRREVRPGDLLMSRANTPDRVGDVAYVRSTRPGLLLPDLLYRITLDPDVSPEFVALALRSTRVRALLMVTARGTSQSMVKLRGEDIAELPIPAAPPAARAAIVDTYSRVESDSLTLLQKMRTAQDLLKERRQALITAAVTGELDVTTARGASA